MNNVRIGLVGLASAVAGFALSGCFASQPDPECNVVQTSAPFGLSPYLVKLAKVDGAGSCSELKSLLVGMQRSRLPPKMGTSTPVNGEFYLDIKPSVLTDVAAGLAFSADSDPSNDCSAGEDCDQCVASGDPDVDNVCQLVPDPVPRTDPSDPEGKKLLGRGTMAQFPKQGVCSATAFSEMAQAFPEEVVDLIDGGTETFPALTMKTEWSNFEILNTAKAPGTVWRARLTYTEGSCVANYDAFAFWPALHCATDADCDPVADVDAGREFGSGFNPDFKPVCNTDLGYCEPTVGWDDLKK
jgi:hypothetical protein